jgi:hypothetical protein
VAIPARVTREEMRDRLQRAPQPRLDYVTDPSITEALAEGYTKVTGENCGSPGRRRFLSACYRVHGPDTLPLLAELYREAGDSTNLLLALREHQPRAVGTPVPTDPTNVSTVPPSPRVGIGTIVPIDEPSPVDGTIVSVDEPAVVSIGNTEPGTPAMSAADTGKLIPFTPDEVNATLAASKPTKPVSLHVRCDFYIDHQSSHRRQGDVWVCDRCAA